LYNHKYYLLRKSYSELIFPALDFVFHLRNSDAPSVWYIGKAKVIIGIINRDQ
jgi:hypothetical protein